jgi:hypothetical protein
MDLGTPPEPGGEIFGSLMKYELQKSPQTLGTQPQEE